MAGHRDKKLTGRLICAWCGKDLGPSNTEENSHGICNLCREALLEEARAEREEERRKRGR